MKFTASLYMLFLFYATVPMSISEAGRNPLGDVPHQTNPPTRVVDLLASQLTMIILALTIVALRLVSRFFVDKNPGWDDYAIIAATVKQDYTLD
jgi:hypothetical protein